MVKLVKEYLYEKFTQDSDPIKDMGIGAKTKYRSIRKEEQNSYILQYSKIKRNIFGKYIEKWKYVHLPLSPSTKKEFYKDTNSEGQNAHYYYVSDRRENFQKFVQRWPRIEDYLEFVEKREEEMRKQEIEIKRKEKEGDIEYLN